MDDVRVLAKGTGIALPGLVVSRVITFVGLTVLARWLGPQTFGLYAIGWTLLKVGSTVASFGLPVGVVRFGSQEIRRNQARFRGVILQSVGSALALGAALGLVLYLTAPWLAETVFHSSDLVPVMRLFAPGIALAAGVHVAAAATRITQKVQYSILVQELMQPSLYLGLSLLVLISGGGLQGVILAALASYALALVAAIVFLLRLFPEIAARRTGIESVLGMLIRFAVPVSLAVTFSTATIWVDRLIVGAFRPVASVGVYQAVSQASTLFAVILGSISLVFGPMAASLSPVKDRVRMLELFRVSTKWTLYASLPVLLVVWFAAPEIIGTLYGGAYVLGAQALVILTIGQILNAGTGPTGPFLNMTGHHGIWFRLSGLALLANMILGILLVPLRGLEGAAVATAISLGGLSVASLAASRKILGAWPYDRRFLKVGGATLATAASLGIVQAVVPFHGPALLFVMALVSVAVFALTVLLLGLEREDRAFLQMVWQFAGSRSKSTEVHSPADASPAQAWIGRTVPPSAGNHAGDGGSADEGVP
jgi:O-antigen/teichoic acid export membrane protein